MSLAAPGWRYTPSLLPNYPLFVCRLISGYNVGETFLCDPLCSSFHLVLQFAEILSWGGTPSVTPFVRVRFTRQGISVQP